VVDVWGLAVPAGEGSPASWWSGAGGPGSFKVLQPEDTGAVMILRPYTATFLLFIEAHLRRTVAHRFSAGGGHHRGMDPLPFQHPALRQGLAGPPAAADRRCGGLGQKTLECGILCSELIRRGRGKRDPGGHHQKHAVSSRRVLDPLLHSRWCGWIRWHFSASASTFPQQNPYSLRRQGIVSVDTLKKRP